MQSHTVSLKQWMIQDMLFLNNLSKSKEIITLLTSIEPFTENKGQNYQCTEGLYLIKLPNGLRTKFFPVLTYLVVVARSSK